MDQMQNPQIPNPMAAEQTMVVSLPSAFKLLGEAFSFYKKHVAVIIGVSSVVALAEIIQVVVGTKVSAIPAVILAILVVIIGLLSRMAMFAAVPEGMPSVGVAYSKGLRMFFPFLWVSILTSLSIMGGFLLLVIPGIMIAVSLSMSVYVLFGENRRGVSALSASWHYVKGRWFSVAWRSVFFGLMVFLVSAILTSILLGPSFYSDALTVKEGARPEAPLWFSVVSILFSNLVVFPLGVIYMYGVYRALKETKAAPTEADEQKNKRSVKIFSILGVVVAVVFAALAGAVLAGLFYKVVGISAPNYQDGNNPQVLLDSSVDTARMRSRDARRASDINFIETALEIYFEEKGTYPTSVSELGGKYLPVVPVDPKTQQPYSYCRTSKKEYHLGASLEEGDNYNLSDDADAISSCLNGADPIYDVKPMPI